MNDITVVIPSIPPRRELLERALASVLNQYVLPAAIKVEVDHDKLGAAATRNRALEGVQTEWLAWLDDDDEFLPNHLETLLGAAQETGADLVYSYGDFIGRGDPLAVSVNGVYVCPLGVPFGPEQEDHLRTKGNFIPVTYLVKTELVKQVGGMPEPNSFPAVASQDCEDYGLLLRLLDAGAKFHHAPAVTWRYYFHPSNTGGRPEWK